ncbi:MAG: hypothetical protein KIH01_03195 [Candidatus Freyarchaeota archaeon]|nr:hypothetical protein [Candidatus Jordarchaeia archaeon]
MDNEEVAGVLSELNPEYVVARCPTLANDARQEFTLRDAVNQLTKDRAVVEACRSI